MDDITSQGYSMPLTVILNVGENPMLLESRSVILRAAKRIAASAMSAKQAAHHFLDGDFDVSRLCHSLPAKDKNRMLRWIRSSGSHTPEIPIPMNPTVERLCQEGEFSGAKIESGQSKILREFHRAFAKRPAKSGKAATTMEDCDTAKVSRGEARRKTILCIDDEPDLLLLRRALLEQAGYLVLTAHSGEDGLKLFALRTVDAVLVDYAMPVMNGGAVAAHMRRINNDVPLVLLSGCSSIPQEELALFHCFIPKGGSPALLLSAIEEVLSNSLLLSTIEELLRGEEPNVTRKKPPAQYPRGDGTYPISRASH